MVYEFWTPLASPDWERLAEPFGARVSGRFVMAAACAAPLLRINRGLQVLGLSGWCQIHPCKCTEKWTQCVVLWWGRVQTNQGVCQLMSSIKTRVKMCSVFIDPLSHAQSCSRRYFMYGIKIKLMDHLISFCTFQAPGQCMAEKLLSPWQTLKTESDLTEP